MEVVLLSGLASHMSHASGLGGLSGPEGMKPTETTLCLAMQREIIISEPVFLKISGAAFAKGDNLSIFITFKFLLSAIAVIVPDTLCFSHQHTPLLCSAPLSDRPVFCSRLGCAAKACSRYKRVEWD